MPQPVDSAKIRDRSSGGKLLGYWPPEQASARSLDKLTSPLMARGWWLLAVALVSSCSPAAGLRGSAPSGGSPATSFQVAKGADSYTTSPTPTAVRGGPLADRLEAALAEIARARGMSLTGDGRLADLATSWRPMSMPTVDRPHRELSTPILTTSA